MVDLIPERKRRVMNRMILANAFIAITMLSFTIMLRARGNDMSTDTTLEGDHIRMGRGVDEMLKKKDEEEEEEESFFVLPVPFNYIFILFLVILSGLFSGLTLGLMSLDPVQLKILVGAGSPQQVKMAKRIRPLRKRGNLLLCTLLLGNVAVNALLSILLADLTSGVVGFLASTFLIVIFGEITPQAICSRYGLITGYYLLPLIYFFVVLLFIFAYPISKILDWILGREIGTIYTREELKQLMDVHATIGSTLTLEETAIIGGALDLPLKEVQQVMTPLEDVFMVEVRDILDEQLVSVIWEKGYSRVPVYDKDRQNIVGLLFAKDLALLNPKAGLPVSRLLPMYGRKLPRVFHDVPLNEMLAEFKAGQSHMAVVRRVNDEGPGDPVYESMGVVTLEDVIEEILQDEIVDETDVYVSNTARTVPQGRGDHHGAMFRSQTNRGLTDEDCEAVIVRLVEQCPDSFAESILSAKVLKKLLSVSLVEEVPSGHALYEAGKESRYFTYVLMGSVYIEDGEHSKTRAEGQALTDEMLWADRTFTADFTAKTMEDTRVLRISCRAYQAAKTATKLATQEGRASMDIGGDSRPSMDFRTSIDVRRPLAHSMMPRR
eukprot:TRINITY_DN1128_c0_g1_i1.p1 TRINITY_DN1128_c0_g1~~TRINITY_DN1128_c0_g1_i1.p1  ORF type:complete len:606 (-),score=152.92 TRINITY_DN1128_c0_g1_i1:143-1960(-)